MTTDNQNGTALSGSTGPQSVTAAAEIRHCLDRWCAAMAAKDARGVLAYMTEDCVEFSLAPPLRAHDPDEFGLNLWFDTWQGRLGFSLEQVSISVDGGLALCHCLARLSGTKTDGVDAGLWFRQTIGLRKADGVWTIFHLHQSVPFYMDGSLRAAVDLDPQSKHDWLG